VYNIPIIVVGVKRFIRAGKKKSKSLFFFDDDLPSVSIVVPAKNEEKVVGRLLKALVNLNYPSSKKEIIVVNDESNDRTGQICSQYASHHPEIQVFHRPVSTTKAAALNFGLKRANGEIIATFDADSVLESDTLLKAVKYLGDRKVVAVQGRICSINTNENILTRFSYYERTVQYEVYTQGKDTLNLFVGLAGTCQFIRRSVLEEVGGWNEETLSEDVELSLRLTEKNYTIRYASDVRAWEETPNSIVGMVRQRARWYRGNIELGLKFGKLMKKLNRRNFDAEMTLFGTYLILLCVVTYFMAAWSFMLPPDFILTLITRFSSVITLAILAFAGVALVCVDKPFRLSNLIWLPFIYAYWGFQSFIAMYAFIQILFRRPLKWSKTRRSGIVTAEHVKKILAAD
jgi:cellulose synthase/poly-beta-1,6-N-acetylglucosamine synthase-like glycosyltransferase